MLRISTRGRYALRTIVDLAMQGMGEPVLGCDIAERQGISADYAAQLFGRLSAAGLVEGVKGPGGGYRLARNPAEITAGDVVRAVEGPLAVVACVDPRAGAACDRAEQCATRWLWDQLSAVMSAYLDSVSVQDLCDRASHGDVVTLPGSDTGSTAHDRRPRRNYVSQPQKDQGA